MTLCLQIRNTHAWRLEIVESCLLRIHTRIGMRYGLSQFMTESNSFETAYGSQEVKIILNMDTRILTFFLLVQLYGSLVSAIGRHFSFFFKIPRFCIFLGVWRNTSQTSSL